MTSLHTLRTILRRQLSRYYVFSLLANFPFILRSFPILIHRAKARMTYVFKHGLANSKGTDFK